MPHAPKVDVKFEQVLSLRGRQQTRTSLLSPFQLRLGGLQRTQCLLPLPLQRAGDQAIVGIDGAIAALSAVDGELRPLHVEPPLLESRFPVAFQALGSFDRGSESRRLKRLQESRGHGFIDLHAADIEAIDAPAFDDDLASTMIAGCRIAAAIVGA